MTGKRINYFLLQRWLGNLLMVLFFCFMLTGCGDSPQRSAEMKEVVKFQKQSLGAKPITNPKKRVLLIDSYHAGYEWSDMVVAAALNVFGSRLKGDDSLDNSSSLVNLKLFRMDTKRQKSIAYKQKIALKVKELIEHWKPDLIIASDDNASKYVIEPYFKNADIPIVFCGLNFGGKPYGFPCKNITGMVEVDLFKKAIELVKPYSRGNRIGFLAADVLSTRKTVKFSQQEFGKHFDKVVFVKTFSEWQKAFKELQVDVDILIVLNYYGIPDYNRKVARTFVLKETKIPTLATLKWMAPVALICLSKVPQEQGDWAAKTALKILKGVSPDRIAIAVNRQVKIYLNMELAKKLHITFPMSLIEKANFVETARPQQGEK